MMLWLDHLARSIIRLFVRPEGSVRTYSLRLVLQVHALQGPLPDLPPLLVVNHSSNLTIHKRILLLLITVSFCPVPRSYGISEGIFHINAARHELLFVDVNFPDICVGP